MTEVISDVVKPSCLVIPVMSEGASPPYPKTTMSGAVLYMSGGKLHIAIDSQVNEQITSSAG